MSAPLTDTIINGLMRAALVAKNDVKLIEEWRNVPMHGESLGISCILSPEPTMDDFDNIYESVRHRIIQSGLYPFVSINLTKMTDARILRPPGLHDIIRPDGPSESWYAIYATTHLWKRSMAWL